MGKFISQYIRKSLKVLKNPKQMIPTIVLGLFWLVLALLGSFGIDPLPVRILSFLTFAQGGMFGGVLGAVGGILGKIVVAAFLNAIIIPLFQKKLPSPESVVESRVFQIPGHQEHYCSCPTTWRDRSFLTGLRFYEQFPVAAKQYRGNNCLCNASAKYGQTGRIFVGTCLFSCR